MSGKKNNPGDEEENVTMLKESFHEGDVIIFLNVYTPYRASRYIKKKKKLATEKKNRQIHNFSWNINNSLLVSKRASRKKS